MNCNLKKISTAVALALFAGSAAAAGGNYINVDGSGTGNVVNIDTSTATTSNVKIFQVGSGDGTVNAERNLVGQSSSSKILVGTDAEVRIGQGKFYDEVSSNFALTQSATKNNLVKSATGILDGFVHISQTSNNNTADVSTAANGTGLVKIIQGYSGANTGISAGGSGFTATVTQKGSGWVSIDQGNSIDSLANGGTATVVHDGSTTVSILQNRSTIGGTGTVYTNTKGDGGNVDIKQTNTGNIYVNSAGDSSNLNEIWVTADVHLVNEGLGNIAIKQVGSTGFTNVYAYLTGGNLTVNDAGLSGNNIYVNAAQNSGNSAGGMSGGNVSVNGAAGNYSNTVKVKNFSAGDLTVNMDGHNNLVKVDSFVGGSATVNQAAASHNSNLYLTSSGAPTTGFVINQNGAFQNLTIDIKNPTSPTTVDAFISGTPASYAVINGSI